MTDLTVALAQSSLIAHGWQTRRVRHSAKHLSLHLVAESPAALVFVSEVSGEPGLSRKAWTFQLPRNWESWNSSSSEIQNSASPLTDSCCRPILAIGAEWLEQRGQTSGN